MVRTGIRELRANLSSYLDRVRAGEELVVTDRGNAIARVVPFDHERSWDRLVREGLIEPAQRERAGLPPRVGADGSVSDLVADQRR